MQAGRQEMLQKESLEKEGRGVVGGAGSQEPGDGDRALVSVRVGRGLGHSAGCGCGREERRACAYPRAVLKMGAGGMDGLVCGKVWQNAGGGYNKEREAGEHGSPGAQLRRGG